MEGWSIEIPGSQPVAVFRGLVLGRLPECDVVIADGMVSGRHLSLEPRDHGILVSDLGSSNGTFIDGQRISVPTLVTESAEVMIGTSKLRLVAPAKPSQQTGGLFIVTQNRGVSSHHVRIEPGITVLVGRSDDCGLVIDDPLVSNEHLRVKLSDSGSDAGIVVEDLGSANGTLLDGESIDAHVELPAPVGAVIQIGETNLVVSRTPNAPRRSPTVIRSTPVPVGDAAPAVAAPLPPVKSSGSKRTLVLGGVIGLVGLALVGVLWSMFGGGGTYDAAWIRENRGPMTVEVAANSTAMEGSSFGSGSIIDADDGLVLTNMHVLADDDGNLLPGIEAGIRLDGIDGWLDVDVIGYAACDDLAILQVRDPSNRDSLRDVPFADPEELREGNTVVALGFPGTLESQEGGTEQMTLTQGVISKLDVRNIDTYPDLIQIDADLNPGNSGGPLFNMAGEQIGVNTLGAGGETQGINYAISIRRVQEVLPDLRGGLRQDGWNSCPA